MAKASDTDILFIAVGMVSPRLVYSSCELHMAKVSTGDGFLSMNCASPSAKEEQGRSRLHQSRDFMLMLCLHSATKEKRCDEITDVFHKLSQFSSSGIDDDMEILVRFVSECMTDPAQLRASTMQDWVCLRGAVTRRA